jgi:hypothetical protein
LGDTLAPSREYASFVASWDGRRPARERKKVTLKMTPEMETLKVRLKATWTSGDYGHFATYLEPSSL